MSNETPGSGFGKFVPGFDFLQSLAKGAAQSMPQMPGLGGWVAPTLSVEELDKRISELKAVQFWLDQNAMALKATIQALEVQRMTLATLKGMNVSMTEVAKAFTAKVPDTFAPRTPERAPEPPAPPAAAPAAAEASEADADAQSAPGVVDPMQWWGALTQQFQQIASAAIKDAAERTAPVAAARQTAAAAKSAKAAPSKTAAKRPAAKKAPARKRAS